MNKQVPAAVVTFLCLFLLGVTAVAQEDEAICDPAVCGGPAYQCYSNADCAPAEICQFETEPVCTNGVCETVDLGGVCVPAPVTCWGDYDCRAGEVCVLDVPGGAGMPAEPCYCPEGDCGDCYADYPAQEGTCQPGQVECGGVVCDPGFECQYVSPPCAPGEDCATIAEAQCTPIQTECFADDECPEGWTCDYAGTRDQCGDTSLVAPQTDREAPPDLQCSGAAKVEAYMCVPPGGSASCSGAVCSVLTDGEQASTGSKRDEGCSVAGLAQKSSGGFAFGALIIGFALVFLRRR